MKFFLKENDRGGETPFTTSVEVKVTDTDIAFHFECKNSKMYSAGTNFNDKLYLGDVVEAFICTSSNRREYYEIEVAPNNAVFFKKIRYYPNEQSVFSTPMENYVTSSVSINGNDYSVDFSVPLSKIGYNEENGIWINAFRVESEGGTKEKNLLSLNPTLRHRFHEPAFFIKIK